jgi:rhomboid protease GluP
MFERKRSGAVLCPSCGQLVGVNDEQCLNCGRRRPGLWGFAPLLQALGREDMGFVPLVLWACGALYIASLAMNPGAIGMRGFGLLSPGGEEVFLLGASGALPVFGYHRWWTVLSAAWLHGSLIHIVFNMMSARDLLPLVAQLYGAGRTVILYHVAAVTGFLASSVVGLYPQYMPSFLQGAGMTLGASASIFGLIGATLHYGHRGGSSLLREHATRWAVGGLIFGFAMPGIDNWAHLGGFAGGYLAARFLDPLKPERGDHLAWALVCLALSAASIAASVVFGLPLI